MVSVINPNHRERFQFRAALQKDWQHFPPVVVEVSMQGR